MNTPCAPPEPRLRFLQDLGPAGRDWLRQVLADRRQPPTPPLLPWRYGAQALGWLLPSTAQALASELGACTFDRLGMSWHADGLRPQDRSFRLQQALQALHARGLIGGWRDELFAFWTPDTELPPADTPPLFALERAAFRPLGLLSHAVHINGFTPDGLMWCGRRALSKSTDAGLLDNLTAGGLAHEESIRVCATRELWEEAGLRGQVFDTLQPAGRVRVSRPDPRGWHDEVLHVFNLTLGHGVTPSNQDGEVSEFVCHPASEVLELLRRGAFTMDAAVSLAWGLGDERVPGRAD